MSDKVKVKLCCATIFSPKDKPEEFVIVGARNAERLEAELVKLGFSHAEFCASKFSHVALTKQEDAMQLAGTGV